MNTHSRWADCRMEILCAHAALCGAGQETARALMGSAHTDAGLDILAEARPAGPDHGQPAVRPPGTPGAAGGDVLPLRAAYCSPIPGACWG